jgi:HK97 family phage portal protein
MFNFLTRDRSPVASESRDAVQSAPPTPPQADERRSQPLDMITQSNPGLLEFFGMADNLTDEVVNVEIALKVPAFGCAVNFLSKTLAALPLKAFVKVEGGREEYSKGKIGSILNHAANDETTAYKARLMFWHSVFTQGRGAIFIERNGRGEVINFWPLDVTRLTVQRVSGRIRYRYQDGARSVYYSGAEVLDIPFLPTADGLGSLSPVYQNADTIGLARAVTRYGARFFNNGGVPPFAIEGPMGSPDALDRASEDLSQAVVEASKKGRNALGVPMGHKLHTLGIDPEKMQMNETKRLLIEEFARIFNMPPAFLQDLTHGTFSNVEQQDLQVVKHVISPWATAFEKEINLKVFGRDNDGVYSEHLVDALLRGDLKTRAEAGSKMIVSGMLTPEEWRKRENLPGMAGANKLFIQGAMVPLENAGAQNVPPPKK